MFRKPLAGASVKPAQGTSVLGGSRCEVGTKQGSWEDSKQNGKFPAHFCQLRSP